MSENGEIYTTGKNFTLPPAVTALTNLTSVPLHWVLIAHYFGLSLNHRVRGWVERYFLCLRICPHFSILNFPAFFARDTGVVSSSSDVNGVVWLKWQQGH